MDFKDLRELKDIKTWSFDELDDAIGSRKKIIDDLNKDVRKLREVKWQKVCDEMKSRVVDSDVDFSPESLNQFFLKSAEAEAEVKPAKPKSKSSRSKKDTEKSEDKDADNDAHSADVVVKNSSPEKTATEFSSENNSANNVATDNSVEADNASEEKLTTEEADVPKDNLQPKEKIVPQENFNTASVEIAVEDTPPTENVEPQNFGNQNTDALNNPDEEIFEDADSQPTNSTSEESREITKKAEVNSQPIKTPSNFSSLNDLQKTAVNLGLPADTSLAEVRKAFGAKINELPPAIAVNFEQMLGKLERGEIA